MINDSPVIVEIMWRLIKLRLSGDYVEITEIPPDIHVIPIRINSVTKGAS